MKIAYLPGVKSWYQNNIFESENDFDSRKSPFIRLKGELNEKGILIETLDSYVVKYDILIIHRIDVNIGRLLKYIRKFPSTKLIYVVTEETLICPIHSINTLKILKFDAVLTWKSTNDKSFFKYYYPNPKLNFKSKFKFNERELLCGIISNKSTPLYQKKTLYNFRHKTVTKLIEDEKFHLFGPGWDHLQDKKNYFGKVKSKAETLMRYKYSLVVENSIEESAVSEKIFDSMASGCVPIYYGCPNIHHLIPTNCFINFNINEPPKIMINNLKCITNEKWEEYIFNIKNFLCSSSYLKFTEYGFTKIISRSITQVTEIESNQSYLKLLLRSILVLLLKPQHIFTKSGLKMAYEVSKSILLPLTKY